MILILRLPSLLVFRAPADAAVRGGQGGGASLVAIAPPLL